MNSDSRPDDDALPRESFTREEALWYALLVSDDCAGQPGSPPGIASADYERLYDRLTRVPQGVAAQLGIDMRNAAREPRLPRNAFKLEPITLLRCLAYVRDDPGFSVEGFENERCGEVLVEIAAMDDDEASVFGFEVVEMLRRVFGPNLPPLFVEKYTEGVADHVITDAAVTEMGAAAVRDRTEDEAAVIAKLIPRYRMVELGLRRFLRLILFAAYGAKASSRASACWEGARRERLMQYGYNDVWSHTYLSELAAVVEKEWTLFERAFGATNREEVLAWFRHINMCRKYVYHHQPLNAADVPFLWVALDGVERTLAQGGLGEQG